MDTKRTVQFIENLLYFNGENRNIDIFVLPNLT